MAAIVGARTQEMEERGKASEAALVPISALQHYIFCPRQCALIHVEQQWAEDGATVEGRLLHERADKPGAARRRGVRTLTALPLRSFALGLSGIADVVEMHAGDRNEAGETPFPVEYKRGRPKAHRADEVQLCAQGLALEEMFGRPVTEGALFYGERRRRMTVSFDAALRDLTTATVRAVRAMITTGTTPPPVYAKAKCTRCSLLEICRPQAMTAPRSVARWMAGLAEG